jgi:hypothetical protein
MLTQWIETCQVQRVSLRGGWVLNLADYNEFVIARRLRPSLPPTRECPSEDVMIDPQLYGKRHGYMTRQPRGPVRVVRHYPPDETRVRLGHVRSWTRP